MGEEGTSFRLQPDGEERAFDLFVQPLERIARACPGEQDALPPLVEEADSVQAKLNCGSPDRSQRSCDILGLRPLNLTDETQRDMELLFTLPGPSGRPTSIGVQAVTPDRSRGPKRDEQPMHGICR